MDLNKLKYHSKWIEFGFITEATILEQNIEFDKGDYLSIEREEQV